jgi:hypothetical protein
LRHVHFRIKIIATNDEDDACTYSHYRGEGTVPLPSMRLPPFDFLFYPA